MPHYSHQLPDKRNTTSLLTKNFDIGVGAFGSNLVEESLQWWSPQFPFQFECSLQGAPREKNEPKSQNEKLKSKLEQKFKETDMRKIEIKNGSCFLFNLAPVRLDKAQVHFSPRRFRKVWRQESRRSPLKK